MWEDLRAVQAEQGGEFVVGTIAPISFDNDTVALQAAQHGVAVCDRAHWGRIAVEGRDRQLFLHNQSTNNLNALKPGQGCDTVFVTSTARTIDLATAYVLDDAVWLLVSPNRREKLLTWLDRYIFFGDQVTLKDVTATTVAFSLIGPESDALLCQFGAAAQIGQPEGSHALYELAGQSVRVAVGSGLGLAGYTLWLEAAGAAALWSALTAAGAVGMGDRAWNYLTILQGRPAPDSELTEDYNPLEAGLWRTVSFSKGCYIGQETIARLDTYKGVKTQLWGIRLPAVVAPGSPITLGEEKVGVLTRAIATPDGSLGLAYIRTKAGGAGLQVQVGEVSGEVVDVPFLTREKTI